MLPKIIRTDIHRYEGTGVRKTEMATQYRKAYVPVTLDVDKEGAILPRLIWWDNGVIFQIDQILYKCRATSKRLGAEASVTQFRFAERSHFFPRRRQVVRRSKGGQLLMILSQRQLEEIAASTRRTSTGSFSGMRRTSPTDQLCQHPLISLQRTISVFAYHSPVSRRTEASAVSLPMPTLSTRSRNLVLRAHWL